MDGKIKDWLDTVESLVAEAGDAEEILLPIWVVRAMIAWARGQLREVVRFCDWKQYTGYGDTQNRELVKRGEIPLRKFGKRAAGAYRDEIIAYQVRRDGGD